MPSDPLLDHLEKTFAEAYRKEVDQEENVWRSLPFFAATLALQVASLGTLRAEQLSRQWSFWYCLCGQRNTCV